ncbi:membrane protein implicated in regulation of membrane protease activity [Peribacillus deserti]|uniref:Membrane protein implicated in regulation of membrane protease activity n=1 Tax=Peribacillus deserti TaxID=673318 RepID=A0ABS2QLL5_9BACI|nr:YndM family protein [Peribacillus deserti]MBM7693900.1 membrane protein implicated in regulation of membrane protease activity [Peribacillus deserti]
MKTLSILLIKFIACLIAFTIGLDLFFDATIADIVSFSIVTALITYLLGDKIALPRLGQTNTLIIEFTLTYLAVWIFGGILLDHYLQIAWGSIISAGIFTFAEILIHRYFLSTAGQPNERRQLRINPKLAYGTEFADEQDPSNKK